MVALNREKPLVVAITGARGAGKTSVAAGVAEVLGWRLLCAEWVASALFGLAREGCGDDEVRHASTVALATARVNVGLGHSCVLDDGQLCQPGVYEALEAVVGEGGGRCLYVYLDCPGDVSLARVGDEGLVEALNRRMCPPGAVVLDGTVAVERSVEVICEVVERAGGISRMRSHSHRYEWPRDW
jgi:hypothetical protein